MTKKNVFLLINNLNCDFITFLKILRKVKYKQSMSKKRHTAKL